MSWCMLWKGKTTQNLKNGKEEGCPEWGRGSLFFLLPPSAARDPTLDIIQQELKNRVQYLPCLYTSGFTLHPVQTTASMKAEEQFHPDFLSMHMVSCLIPWQSSWLHNLTTIACTLQIVQQRLAEMSGIFILVSVKDDGVGYYLIFSVFLNLWVAL